MKLQAQGIQIRESVLGIIFLHVCIIGTELSLTVRRFLVLATYTLSGIKQGSHRLEKYLNIHDCLEST